MKLNELIKAKEEQLETIELELEALRALEKSKQVVRDTVGVEETLANEERILGEIESIVRPYAGPWGLVSVLGTLIDLVYRYAPGIEAGSEVDDLRRAEVDLTAWRVFLRVKHGDDVESALEDLMERSKV